MKVRFMGLLMCLVLLMQSSCSTKPVYYAQVEKPLNIACEKENSIYFIHPMNEKLYKMNDDNSISELVLEKEMKVFTFTDDYLIYVNKNSDLVIHNKNELRTLQWNIKNYYESAIYDDRIIYLNKSEEIIIMDFNGEQIAKIDEKNVSKMQPYKNGICYTIKNEGILMPQMTIMKMDLNGRYKKALLDSWVYRMSTKGDWIYYVADNYSLYRFSELNNIKEQLVDYIDWFEFEVMEDHIVCRRSEDMIICDLNGENIEVIEDNRDNDILDADKGIVVYQEFEKGYVGIYDIEDKTVSKIITTETLRDCVILDDLIYMVFRDYDTAGELVSMSGGFYSFDGQLVYSFD